MKPALPGELDRPGRTSIRSKLAQVLTQIVVIPLITIALLEVLVALSFRHPSWSPIPISLVRYLHTRFDRNVIQVMPECAVYDETLTYTLKPGHCTFASREFSNEYSINSLGVRDDEASLTRPHTVMLGDSLTMGWGVDQDQNFPAVFERLSGLRTLNAGVSSYGTVRELRILERVDRTALKNIVIQYDENDAFENAQLVEHPPFTILSRAQYERTIHDQDRLLRYFPGKYAFNVLVQLQSGLRRRMGRQKESTAISVDHQAELFIRVVEQSPVDLSPFRLTVVSADGRFVESARRVAEASVSWWVRKMEFLDVTPSTVGLRNPYYLLDTHPTAVAHEAFAKLLVQQLAGGGS